jgi:hypothetical protein
VLDVQASSSPRHLSAGYSTGSRSTHQVSNTCPAYPFECSYASFPEPDPPATYGKRWAARLAASVGNGGLIAESMRRFAACRLIVAAAHAASAIATMTCDDRTCDEGCLPVDPGHPTRVAKASGAPASSTRGNQCRVLEKEPQDLGGGVGPLGVGVGTHRIAAEPCV